MVRSAYRLHAEDDDFGQAGTLVREVFDEAQRDTLVETVTGALSGVTGEVLDRAFAYNDAQRNRIGTNFHQLPVNRPKVPVNTYMFDGQMTYETSGNAPVYAPNSGGRPWADATGPVADGWEADGEMVRMAYTLRRDDDDFTQPGILVRKVFDHAQREALVDQVAGSLLGGVRSPVLERAFDYWKRIDPTVGQRIEDKVRKGTATQPAEGMGEA
jgi:catalase